MNRKRSRFDRLMLPTLAAAALGSLSSTASAVPIGYISGTYTENFDTLANSSTSSALPTGWALLEGGSNANSLYLAGTGSGNAGDTYSFGLAGSTERALGTLLSGSLNSIIGAEFRNDSGSTITELTISYTGEQWRRGNTTLGAADRLNFAIGVGATGLNSGTFVDVDALDFTSRNTGSSTATLNGNDVVNRLAITHTITGLNIAANDVFWIRWADADLAPGADDGLAIDDFSLSTTAAPPPPPPPPPASAAVLPTAGNTLTFDFTGFTGSGFAPTPTAGQLDSDNFIVTGFDGGTLAFGGTQTTPSTDFARGASAGSVAAGGIYAFDHGAGDVGLGVQSSGGNFQPGDILLRLQNTTGGIIDALSVMYDVWVFNDENRSNSFDFSYSIDGTNFIDVPALDLASVGPEETAAVWELFARSTTLTSLGLADGAFLFLRWTGDDLGPSGASDQFALDNIRISNGIAAPAAVPEPATLSMLGLAGLMLVRRRRMA